MKGEISKAAQVLKLSKAEADTLLVIARDALQGAAEGVAGLAFDPTQYALGEALCAHRATFVTLYSGPALRGCIGNLYPVDSLCKSVHRNTVAAAIGDMRFAPVASDETARIRISISLLGDIAPIAGLEEFVPGRHGIVMTLGRLRSVFLPEVAAEQGWTREETASALCVKAGAAGEAWRNEGTFSVFETWVLNEPR